MKLAIVEKNFLSWTAMHIDFVMCKKGNMSPKLRKMFFFAQKLVIFSKNSVFDESQFSLKSLINRKNQPHTLPQQVLAQQTPIILLLLQAPVRNCHVRNCREAVLPERDENSEGARGDRGSPDQNESPIPDLSNVF